MIKSLGEEADHHRLVREKEDIIMSRRDIGTGENTVQIQKTDIGDLADTGKDRPVIVVCHIVKTREEGISPIVDGRDRDTET